MKPNLEDITTERRSFGEVRMGEPATPDSMPEIRGYAAKFNVLSERLFGFRERIIPGAFSGVLGDDVRALIDHQGLPLARTTSGTLRLSQDSTGLRFEFTPPNTEAARALVEGMRRGDISQASFQFQTRKDMWDFEEDEERGTIRVIRQFSRLLDVSVVTFPAYPDTEAEAVRRTYDAYQAGRIDTEHTPSPYNAEALRRLANCR